MYLNTADRYFDIRLHDIVINFDTITEARLPEFNQIVMTVVINPGITINYLIP